MWGAMIARFLTRPYVLNRARGFFFVYCLSLVFWFFLKCSLSIPQARKLWRAIFARFLHLPCLLNRGRVVVFPLFIFKISFLVSSKMFPFNPTSREVVGSHIRRVLTPHLSFEKGVELYSLFTV